ncbi:docking protein 1-like [Mastacembelus armatus]|uniref:Docking protein 1-like n=1 Tax=Mastacembelus armatus TaxID=205130 RepID=A0A7N8XF83_9TELE|nr:docking protein 1-like [Mastacembelus armatus]
MDSQTKTGKVYLQLQKASKKWKPVWLSLFPPSSSGVGRLEIQDIGGSDIGAVSRRHHQPQGDRKLKVVRLSELISVLRLPPNAEACPMENMAAFCVETQDRTMVYAALKDECMDWVEKLCQCTFQRSDGSRANQLHMEENQIYASVDQASEFWVVIQKTDAATRCGLQGSYWLQIGPESLLLKESQKNIVREWPYELLRRYGKDKLALTIEAGRRCHSGPGTFIFETQQAEKIFSLIQTTIKRKTPSQQNQESEKVTQTNIQAHSPLPRTPDMTIMAAFLENKLRTQEKKCAASDGTAYIQEDLVGQSECVSAQPAPITLMPLPLVPTHESISGRHNGDPTDAVYANPSDCLQSALTPQLTSAVYVDPAHVLPLKPPSSREPVTSVPSLSISHHDSVYAEVFDKISSAQNKQAVQSKGKTKHTDDEPIYTEPLNKKEEVCHKNETKPDPFAHLYAHVCKPAPSSSPSISSHSASVTDSTTTKKDAGTSLDDVVYENLGVI